MMNIPSVKPAKPIVKEPGFWESLPGIALSGLITGIGAGGGQLLGNAIAPGVGGAVGGSVGGSLAAPIAQKVAQEVSPQATVTGGTQPTPLPSMPTSELKPYQANALAQYINARRRNA